jgi:hypothetical protein
MPILDCIIAVFVCVDDKIKHLPTRSNEILSPSELVTIGILYALKGVSQSAFYRWLSFNYRHLFPHLPERTRLFRRLAKRQDWTNYFLADIGLLGIADTFAVELLHPRRLGRSQKNIATKGISNHRWIAGVKVCDLINHCGRVVEWQWSGANLHDSHFRTMLGAFGPSAILTDSGFHGKVGDPQNLNICRKGQCNARFLVESVFSLWTRFLGLKRVSERHLLCVQAHFAYAIAAFNVVQALFANRPDETGKMP